MYKNILVPVALDHGGTFPKAYELARRLSGEGAKITALTVMEAVPGFARLYLPEDHVEKAEETVRKTLKTVTGDVEDVAVEVVSGHSGQTIIDYADAHNIDCIVIPSHRPGLTGFFLGSTAARVVRYFQGSVLVLR